jgi:hypothetical protein
MKGQRVLPPGGGASGWRHIDGITPRRPPLTRRVHPATAVITDRRDAAERCPCDATGARTALDRSEKRSSSDYQAAVASRHLEIVDMIFLPLVEKYHVPESTS